MGSQNGSSENEPTDTKQSQRMYETETVGGVQEDLYPDAKQGLVTKYLGIVLALLSVLINSISQATQKLLLYPKWFKSGNHTKKTTFGPFNMAAWTFSLQFLLMIPILICYNFCNKEGVLEPIRPFCSNIKSIILMLIEATASSGGLILFYIGLEYLDLAEAVVLISSVHIFVYILCRIFLKEPLGWLILATSVLALGGVVIITQPTWLSRDMNFKKKKLFGIMYCLFASLCLSIGLMIVRFKQHIFPGLVSTISYFFGAVLGIFFAASFQQLALPQKSSFSVTNEYFLLVAIAAMTVTAQALLIVALHYEKAGPVSLILTLGVALSVCWQIAFLETEPNKWSIIGGTMIVVAVLVTIFTKRNG